MKKRTVSFGTSLMIVLLTAVVTFNITFFVAAEYYSARLGNLQQDEARYAKLKSVAEAVEKYFIGEYDEQAALEAAAAGYVDGLGDQWSVYLTAEQTERLLEEEANAYVGVGLTYSLEESSLYAVVSVTPDSPAAAAGILVGDVLVAVDDTPVEQLGPASELSNVVKGEEGTPVALTVRRGEQELRFEMLRASVYNEGVSAELLEGNIGYLRISGFETNVDVEFSEKVQSLIDGGAQALVFDVRWNPGGYLNVMRAMLDLLLPEGVVISTVDKQGAVREYTSDAACLSMPMAVLVNEHSVSAAEFFAAALQEYGVAAVVGAHTGGKGYSQQLIRLDDGASINLSTTRYYTPKGANLAGVGIAPDYEVEGDPDTGYAAAHELDAQLRQALSLMREAVVALPVPEEGDGTTELPIETPPAA